MSSFVSELAERSVLVCCGPGGVGKTTVSATLGLTLASRGKRVCVLTVDPARRLGDALGLDELSNDPVSVPGVINGSLWAVMLDTKKTFDGLIDQYATTPEQATSIKANRLYQNLSSALSGTQEYMAMEKLYELVSSGTYDIVVVDTPPTRNALELLDAPQRLTSFLQNRIFRALLTPTKAYLKAVSLATRTLLSTIGNVAGAELLDDVLTFFQAFAGMEEGFASRAQEIHEQLRMPSTGFVLVSSPRNDAIAEATFFDRRLRDAGLSTAGLVINRVYPKFFDGTIQHALRSKKEGALAVLVENLERAMEITTREAVACAGLIEAVAPAPVALIPLTIDEVHDLGGLMRLGEFFDDAPSIPPRSIRESG
jgi:anion-transporting  ArsA/GET3 family ATPase